MEEYQIFSSPQVRSRDWPQQIWAASFFLLYPSQIYSFIHCLVDVSSETLDLCVLLPYSSKFNLFPLFLSGTALAKVFFFFFFQSAYPTQWCDTVLGRRRCTRWYFIAFRLIFFLLMRTTIRTLTLHACMCVRTGLSYHLYLVLFCTNERT